MNLKYPLDLARKRGHISFVSYQFRDGIFVCQLNKVMLFTSQLRASSRKKLLLAAQLQGLANNNTCTACVFAARDRRGSDCKYTRSKFSHDAAHCKNIPFQQITLHGVSCPCGLLIEPRCEKTGLRSFRLGPTQTRL